MTDDRLLSVIGVVYVLVQAIVVALFIVAARLRDADLDTNTFANNPESSGLRLGFARVKNNSIYPPIAVHALQNIIATLSLWLSYRSRPTAPDDSVIEVLRRVGAYSPYHKASDFGHFCHVWCSGSSLFESNYAIPAAGQQG